MMYQVLDLFSGIGGFSLGLERTGGFKTVAFCEIEPFCRAVLKKHWPEVPCYDDITTLTADRLAADGIRPDVLCGDFPCQDISVAGKGAGLEGERSGLWREYARLVGEIRPRFAIVENVAALLGRGLGRVLGDLAALGYDAEWDSICASDLGAWHERERFWLIAYPMREGLEGLWCPSRIQEEISIARGTLFATDTPREPWLHGIWERGLSAWVDGNPDRPTWAGQQWPETESVLCRVADGIPDRVGRTTAQGNAVVPQIPQIIGEAILRTGA
jgi:DNA (cytosine-5)-methyltransferase 1